MKTNPDDVIDTVVETKYMSYNPGLTKREWFTGMAMQGLAANPEGWPVKSDIIAKYAVEFADALIAELNGEVPS